MPEYSALVQPLSSLALAEADRRATVRHATSGDALSRPQDSLDAHANWWGAVVRDLSSTGIGLSLCYPFRAGTYLAVDLHGPAGKRTLLSRVVHVRDQTDGTWHLGCELVKPLTDSDVELMI